VIAFADSSALVTRYAPAEHDVLPPEAAVTVSAIARVEVVSALWRRAHAGELSLEDTTALVREFVADYQGTPYEARRYQPVASSRSLLERAAGLVAGRGLRTLDAIQLASALAARRSEPDCRTMIVLDEKLRWAAAAEGFELLPA
jgi:uncharacterized protein